MNFLVHTGIPDELLSGGGKHDGAVNGSDSIVTRKGMLKIDHLACVKPIQVPSQYASGTGLTEE